MARKKLEELIVLDDWTDIITNMIPSIKKGAYNVIDWAHKNYVKPELAKIEVDDELEDLKRQHELDLKRQKVFLDKEKNKLILAR